MSVATNCLNREGLEPKGYGKKKKDQHFLRNLHQIAAAGHDWIPVQDLPFDELILFAYAADRTPRPTYVCLPSGLYHARTGRVLPQTGPSQEITPLPGIY